MDLDLGDGRALHVYDIGADDADGRLAVFWHHGTPNIGAPPEPLFAAAEELGIRWVSYDRPDTGDQALNLAGTWHQRPLTSRASPMHWAYIGSRSWAILVAVRTPWHAARCSRDASSAWSSGPGWHRSAPRGSTS